MSHGSPAMSSGPMSHLGHVPGLNSHASHVAQLSTPVPMSATSRHQTPTKVYKKKVNLKYAKFWNIELEYSKITHKAWGRKV